MPAPPDDAPPPAAGAAAAGWLGGGAGDDAGAEEARGGGAWLAMDWNGLVCPVFAALAGLADVGWPAPAPVVGVPLGDPEPDGADVPDGVPDDAPGVDGEPAPEGDGLEPPELIGLVGEEGLEGELGLPRPPGLPAPLGAPVPVAAAASDGLGGGVGVPSAPVRGGLGGVAVCPDETGAGDPGMEGFWRRKPLAGGPAGPG